MEEHPVLTVVFDIDSTLTDPSHRLHLIEGPGKPDWDAFNDLVGEDTPNEWALEILRAMSARGYRVVLVSARMERYRGITREWLARYNVLHLISGIYLRPDDRGVDPSQDIKRELYLKYVAPVCDVQFVVDDRRKDARMWRELGLVCLHCAEGDY